VPRAGPSYQSRAGTAEMMVLGASATTTAYSSRADGNDGAHQPCKREVATATLCQPV